MQAHAAPYGNISILDRMRASVAQWLLQQERNVDHDMVRVLLLAWIGLVALPAYYIVWTWLLPQPFESLALRAAGMALCLVLVVGLHAMTPRWRRIYAFATVTYALPFLFTYMYLMNGGAPAWSQSMVVALILLFHFPLPYALASFALGAGAAVALFAATGNIAFLTSVAVLEQLPVSLFTVLVVLIAKVGRRMLAQEKLAGMAHGLATVSHELRTPLVSVDANVRGMSRMLARTDDCPPELSDALARIQFEVRHMNHLVDLFLLSATAVKQHIEPTEMVSMKEVVENVIRRYPFCSKAQKDSVVLDVRRDFRFAGQHELCVVILLNLLRNSLKALHRAGKGRVRVVVDGSREAPRLLFIDTGCGIANAELPHIFKRFYSHPHGTGAGIGLALCKDILDAWHASIRCLSRQHAYTMFVLEFPATPKLAPRPATRFDHPPMPCPYPSTSTPA